MIGQIVGNYKILEALGEGGVGMVYKGVDTMLDREVAVKVLRPELASQTAVVERFRSEAVTLAKLSHPNIATLFSLFRHANDLIMVLEFVRGEALDTIIQRRGRLAAEEAVPIFCQALDGINHAHDLGIIHRDIKPSNMILTENGTLKVLDFGIARLLGSSRMTRVGNIIGTLEYMSPEQVRGEETDARSDIYGLGMMLYEILTGKLPFESENEFVLMKMQTENMPAPPRQLNPDIPVEIEASIMRSIAKKPSDRFQDAGEFLDTLLSVDLALSESNHFGKASLLQAKLRTRPSNPAISKPAPFSGEPPQTGNINKPSEPVTANAAFKANDTKDFIPDIESDTLVLGQVQGDTAAPGQPGNIAAPNAVMKETRLGSTGDAPVYAPDVKATRLGEIGTASPGYSAGDPPSFFDRLTWIHYAGAGALVVIIFSFIGLAAIVPIILSFSSEPPVAIQAPVAGKANTDTNAVTTVEEKKPETIAPPQITEKEPPAFEPIKPIETEPEPPARSGEKPGEKKIERVERNQPKEAKTTKTPKSTKRPTTRATPSLTDN